MSMEQNQQVGKHLSFQSVFCFLTRLVQDFFPLCPACKILVDIGPQRSFLEEGMKQEGKKIYPFEEHRSRLGWWKLFTFKLNRINFIFKN